MCQRTIRMADWKISATKSAFFGSVMGVIVIFFIASNFIHLDEQIKDITPLIFLQKQRSLHIRNLIPAKIIHQTWKTTKIPKRFAKWSKTWRECFPTWSFKLWNDTENREFIAKHYPWFLDDYDNFRSSINRADAVRYLYLFHYGGIYTDLDNECLRPFEHLLVNHSLVFGAMEGQFGVDVKEGYVQNSFMYSRPRHPFWLEVVHEIRDRRKYNPPPETLAGPVALGHIINSYRNRFKKDIKIYPPSYFNPNSWLKERLKGCKDFNRMTDKELQKCRSNFNSSYVVQYHTQTWGKGKRAFRK